MMAVQLSDDSIGKAARRQQIIDGLHDIPGQIKRVLDQDKEFQSLAKDMLGEKSLLIMGRGYQCTCLSPQCLAACWWAVYKDALEWFEVAAMARNCGASMETC